MSSKTKKKVYKKTIINNSKKNQLDNPQKFSDILSIPSNPEDIFTLISPIGHGAFGTVYKAIHNASKQMYAIKIIQYFKEENNLISNINHMENINFCYKTVQEETSLMRIVNSSDYIVKYYGSYFSRQTNTLWLILEYCASGSVIDLMLAMDRTYSEIETATIVKMILEGLILIHSKNLIHRDVKGANILLSEEGYAKIGDFGVGVKLSKELDNFRKSKKGSPYWMSPQVVLNEKYSTGADIWSLGITCLELMNGEPPNSSLKPLEVMEKIGTCNIDFRELFGEKNKYSEDFKDFVKKCLVIEEKKRGKAKELINHKFIIKKAKDNKLLSDLYKKHIEDLEDYRKEVEEYEMELRMKKKKEREQQILCQKQKEIQNMSIKYDSEENKEEMNYITKNNINKSNDEELFFNKSINSLLINENNNEEGKEESESSILKNNNSIKYIDNISGVPKTKNNLSSPIGNIFDDDNDNKGRYANTFSDNNIYIKYENNLTSDIVNQSTNLKNNNLNEYTLESNFKNNIKNNEISNKFRNKTTNKKKSKIKCTIINFTKPMNSRQKNNNSVGLNKTMDYKIDNSFELNKKLLLSYKNEVNIKNKDNNQINKRKSENLINNIKSLSILSNKDLLENKENIKINNEKGILEDENEYRYKPILTEDNIIENKNTAFNKFINNHKQLKKKENNNLINKTTDNTNTYDNSNSNFNTNNISNNLSFINNNSYICSNRNKNDKNKFESKKFEKPINVSKINMNNNTKELEIKGNIYNKRSENSSSNRNNEEDINDSDDDGTINNVNNLCSKDNFKDIYENKENFDNNLNYKDIINKSKNLTISSHTIHSYSVSESNDYFQSIHQNNIFSYAHKKYFS